ncbi:hypothetical protein F3Y22_tig00111388pilonHSYRG00182 [Hibiscus syriacus]|uniref:RNase H type-1 domain-containing protein n=1 Tax=Hibiscus syriacus TaxID=106335 RepID=A0A6A2YMC1_HIBSY|nr:hypothetical protein F3Y22_tig00111388pilonHSYRG00182 [Hibiscus syriacus]
MNMNSSDDLVKYLGVPLKHGRLTLISSVTSAIPTYSMMTTRLPSSVVEGIDKMNRRFLWGGSAERQVPHLVSWEEVCNPKRYGGLGIRSMAKHNAVLLQKTAWRFLNQPDSRWVRPFKTVYRVHGDPLHWRNRLFTNARRASLGLSTSSSSIACGHPVEDIGHILRAQNIWNRSVPSSRRGAFYSQDLQEWLQDNLSASSNSQAWTIHFASAVWNLWKDRCRRVFDPADHSNDESEAWMNICSSANELIRQKTKPAMDSSPIHTVAWSPPLNSFLKLNTDGASQGNPGVAGAGGLLRDEMGHWGVRGSAGVCSSVAAELYAIRMIYRLHGSLDIDFRHTYREGNFCVDALTNMGCSLEDDLMIFQSFPPDVSALLEADSRGLAFPRLN